jgi:hypothetical protein
LRKLILVGLLDHDGEGTGVLRNVGRYSPKDRASHHEIGVSDGVVFVLIELTTAGTCQVCRIFLQCSIRSVVL